MFKLLKTSYKIIMRFKKTMRQRALVVLIFTKCPKERVGYVINSVLGQNVKCDILIAGNRNSGLNFEEMFEIIDYVGDRDIHVYFPINIMSDRDIIKYIRSYINKHSYDIVLTLWNGKAFATSNTLYELIEKSKARFYSIAGKSYVISQDGSFLKIQAGKGGIISINNAIKWGGVLINSLCMHKRHICVIPTRKVFYQEMIYNSELSHLQSYEIDKMCFEANKPMKVVFFAQEKATWNSLKSVYDSMRKDSRFEVTLVYVQGHHQNNMNKDT